MNEAIRAAINAALLHFVWEGAAVGLILWLALATVRTAATRYIACCAALATLILLPFITAFLVYQPVPPSAAAWAISALPGAVGFRVAEPDRPGWLDQARGWALPVWALGVGVFSLRMAWGWGQAAWLRRRGTSAGGELTAMASNLAARMGVTRGFGVLVSRAADGASVVGWLRPAILIPAAALTGLTPEQLEAVLAHELAHIRRADYLVNLLQSAVETLLFYHPAVWWVSSRIRHERELCCDDLAVRTCGDALVYARALTSLEKLRMSAPRMAMAGAGGKLLYRIRRIVGIDADVAPSKSQVLLALAVVLVAGALGLTRAHAAQSVAQGKAQGVAQESLETMGRARFLELSYEFHRAEASHEAVRMREVLDALKTLGTKAAGTKLQGAIDKEIEQDTRAAAKGRHPEMVTVAALQGQTGSAEPDAEAARGKAEAQVRLAQLMFEYLQLRREVAVDAESRRDLSRRTLEIETAMEEQEKIIGAPAAAASGIRPERDYAALLAELQVKVDEALREPHSPAQEEFLRKQLEDLQSRLARTPMFVQNGAKERFELRLLEEKLRAAVERQEAELMRRRAQADPGASEAPEVGVIVFTGVPPAEENELRSRLPVKAGERLSGRALRDSYTVVSGYDQRLDLWSLWWVRAGRRFGFRRAETNGLAPDGQHHLHARQARRLLLKPCFCL